MVDDDPGLLRLLTIRLRAENYEVEAVESAAAALAACTRFRPDLVITDLRMDQMDGIGLFKELQSRWPGLKVIILTAHGTIPDAVHATQSGAFGFLTKPVDKQDLLDHVQKALKVSGFAHVDEDWRAEDHHPQPADGGQARAGEHGGGHRRARAHHRRERHRQGVARARHSRGEPAPQQAVRGRQLQRHGREYARVRAVRSREGRVSRRHPRAERPVRDARRRHACCSTRSATCRCACR